MKFIVTSGFTLSLLPSYPSLFFLQSPHIYYAFVREELLGVFVSWPQLLSASAETLTARFVVGRARQGTGFHRAGHLLRNDDAAFVLRNLMFLFDCNKSETVHNGRKSGKINNGNHFSLTSQVIRPDPKSQWSALWLTTDGTMRLVSQWYADFLISQFSWFYVLRFALDLQQKLGPSGEQYHLSLAKQNTQERGRQGSACFATTAYQLVLTEIFIWPALSPVPPMPLQILQSHAKTESASPELEGHCQGL